MGLQTIMKGYDYNIVGHGRFWMITIATKRVKDITQCDTEH